MLQKNGSTLQNYAEAVQYEWLETNGLGGWAGSSIIGCNTRRYHGLLVAAVVPPAERMNLVSKLDETIIINHERTELGTNNYGDAIHPNGYHYLTSFTKNLFPEWLYEINNIQLKKTIAMVQGENTTVIVYDVIKAPQPFTLELLPLLSVRGYHNLTHANNSIQTGATFDNSVFTTRVYDGTPAIFIKAPGAAYQHNPDWFYHFNYAIEQYRGLDFTEDLFSPGHFTVELKQGDSIGIILSTEDLTGKDAHRLLAQEKSRRESLLNQPVNFSTSQFLTLAADQFIVKKGEALKTVIAGYHWFTDWGRDTMISLPGLCLSTGRLEDAKKIIVSFAKSVSEGMLPNRFPDNGEAPEYNNADGTLWYFIAVYKYLQASGDKAFVLKEILPVLTDITDRHFKGTRFNIHVTEDGLLYAGEKGQQLTWMDARIGNWVVTPRMGKPVEIQALWYNALMIYSELLKLNRKKKLSDEFASKAAKAKKSFNTLFWNKKGNYLYDVIDENGNADDTLRPNQLFAISLPFALTEGKQAKAVLKIVESKLVTPVGLRTLPEDYPNYVPVYGGDQFKRDNAYHQGTVWSWLLGPYVDAVMKSDSRSKKTKARKIIAAFQYHLNEACIGSVSEIFDASAPHHPRGCVAQAWGVAEVLRVITEYGLS